MAPMRRSTGRARVSGRELGRKARGAIRQVVWLLRSMRGRREGEGESDKSRDVQRARGNREAQMNAEIS